MSTSRSFPPELWGLVLLSFKDWKIQEELAYLWLVARHVCGQFKTTIEKIFETEHLPKTWLHMDLGESLSTLPSIGFCDAVLSWYLSATLLLRRLS